MQIIYLSSQNFETLSRLRYFKFLILNAEAHAQLLNLHST